MIKDIIGAHIWKNMKTEYYYNEAEQNKKECQWPTRSLASGGVVSYDTTQDFGEFTSRPSLLRTPRTHATPRIRCTQRSNSA